jgi:SAM-dependent methyltransferase
VADEYAAVAELYDHVTVYRGRTDVAFFVSAARDAGGPVLEVGSGSGRVLIPVARAGVAVTGVDLSPAMLAACRRRLDVEPPEVRARVTLHQADMRAFDLGRRARFALATMPFRSFQHLLTTDDQLACLACVRRHLAPGGRLVLDVFNPSLEALAQPVPTAEQAEGPPTDLPDGSRLERTARRVAHDRPAQVIHAELIYHVTHPDGRRERLVHAVGLRYLFRFEVEHLLARAGFAVEHLYAGYDRAPYGSVYPGELVFVVRKAGERESVRERSRFSG